MKNTIKDQTNFLIAISPDGRIESIDLFCEKDEIEEDGMTSSHQNLFTATVQSRWLSPKLHESQSSSLLMTVYPDGRFKSFRSSRTALADWDVEWHKSQYMKLLQAYLSEPDSGAIFDAEIAPDDPQAEKKRAIVQKMGELTADHPVVGKNWDAPAAPNGAAVNVPAEFAGWYGNAKKIPLLKDDANYDEKKSRSCSCRIFIFQGRQSVDSSIETLSTLRRIELSICRDEHHVNRDHNWPA